MRELGTRHLRQGLHGHRNPVRRASGHHTAEGRHREGVRDIFERYHNCDNGRIKIWVAPAAMWSNTRETLQMLWKAPTSTNQALPYISLRRSLTGEAAKGIHGLWDIDAMIDTGICGPNVLMVHCVHLTDEDIEKARNMTLRSPTMYVPTCTCHQAWHLFQSF